MSDPNGPKVDIPDELAAELDSGAAEAAQASGPAREGAAAPEEPAPGEAAEASEAAEAGEAAEADEAAEAAEAADAAEAVAALNDKYLRLAAEFENYKRRMLKERQDLLNYGTENLVKELLSTVDNLERALGHAQQEEGVDTESMREGVELTYRSLLQTLEKLGLQAVEADGAPFDPKVHEAIRQVPTAEVEPSTVIEVYQKGYLLKDRLLRPALVAVAGPAAEGSE